MNTSEPLLELQRSLYRHVRGVGLPVAELLPWLVHPDNLQAAWGRVCAAGGAQTPGPDGLRCSDLPSGGRRLLAELAEELGTGLYQPLLPRRMEIPKPSGGTRGLGILAVRDRVVHAALKQVLEPVFEPLFWERSFGFRPGRSVHSALSSVAAHLTAKRDRTPAYPWALRLDVVKCFDHLDHWHLLQQIAGCVSDPALLDLLQRILRAGGRQCGALWWRRWIGVVQGSALSPLLCNLYLDPLDRQLQTIEDSQPGEVAGFRYADDLLLVARRRRAALRAAAQLRRAARGLRLTLGSKGLRLVRVERGVPWLGVLIEPRRSAGDGPCGFGFRIPEDKVAAMLETVQELTDVFGWRIPQEAVRIDQLLRAVNVKLTRWRLAYGWADNAAEAFAAVDRRVHRNVRTLLLRTSGLSESDMRARHFVRLPRGFGTWQAEGVRLVNLAALPPLRLRTRPSQPPWQQPHRRKPRSMALQSRALAHPHNRSPITDH